MSFLRTLRLSALVAAACGLLGLGVTAPAQADDRPFWEQDRPVAKAKPAAKVSYKKSPAASQPAKKYASKPAKKHVQASSGSDKKLGGYAEATEPKKKRKGVRVAALGSSYVPDEPKKSLSGGSVRWTASAGCLDSGLRAIVGQVAANYGPVTVNSTCRSRGHNRAVGGAPKSKHLSGDAVDFRVHGNVSAVYAFLRRNGGVGGLKHYGGGLFHIDNGERRSW